MDIVIVCRFGSIFKVVANDMLRATTVARAAINSVPANIVSDARTALVKYGLDFCFVSPPQSQYCHINMFPTTFLGAS